MGTSHIEKIKKNNFAGFFSKGQSLIEILIALTVGGILIGGAITAVTLSLRSNLNVKTTQFASSIADELINNVQALAESNWQNIYSLSKGASSTYFVAGSNVISGQESVLDSSPSGGLAGFWKFDEATGTIAYDSSGNNNQGILTSGPTRIASSSCQVGNCLSFNGSSAYVDMGTKFPSITSAITVSAWVNPGASQMLYADIWGDHQSDFKGMVMQQNSGNTNQYSWAYGNGIGWTNNSGFFNLTTNAWTHVVAVKDANYCYVYLNGVEQVSARGNCVDNIVPATTMNFSVALGYAGGGRYFNGFVDDVRVYNRVLSGIEVKNLYNSNLFTRYFYVANVNRDTGGNISVSGTDDPSTQKITVTVNFQGGRTLSKTQYLTRGRNKIFIQNSWFGGAGQENFATSTNGTIVNNMFSTSTNIDYSTSTGIRIQGL